MFIQTPKCASSTSAGIARRLAAHANLSHTMDGDSYLADDVEPKVYANDISRRELDARDDVRNLQLPVFPRWTMLRHPAERALSMFAAERGGAATDDETIIRYLNGSSRSLFEYVSPEVCDTVAVPERQIACALDAYDFVGVVELFDESMLHLAGLLDVPLSAVLYLAAKVSDVVAPDDANATTTNLGQSPAVRAYLKSAAWLEKSEVDYKLWQAAYRRLAAHAGKTQAPLLVYRNMLAEATAKCTYSDYNATADCPFSSPGYWRDSGCGYACFDDLYGN